MVGYLIVAAVVVYLVRAAFVYWIDVTVEPAPHEPPRTDSRFMHAVKFWGAVLAAPFVLALVGLFFYALIDATSWGLNGPLP